jgi:hypothetical protein
LGPIIVASPKSQTRTRLWIARGFAVVEDVQYFILELGVLTVLILSLAVSLFVLRKQEVRHEKL